MHAEQKKRIKIKMKQKQAPREMPSNYFVQANTTRIRVYVFLCVCAQGETEIVIVKSVFMMSDVCLGETHFYFSLLFFFYSRVHNLHTSSV